MGATGSKLEKALGDQFPEGERYFGRLENFGNTCYCNSVLQMTQMSSDTMRRIIVYFAIYWYMMTLVITLFRRNNSRYLRILNSRRLGWRHFDRQEIRIIHLRRFIYDTDLACRENTRMILMAFLKLCDLLQTVGKLSPSKNMSIEEMVAMFLHICAHDVKNRVIKRQFVRSGETISRVFGTVLNAVLRLQDCLLKKPEPVPENSTDRRWKWFKNCLGALDGTYIKVHVPIMDKPRYRTRKNEIATNVLGVCSQDMQFIYILPGWEGSAADSRVLRDAINRRNGLKIPQGH